MVVAGVWTMTERSGNEIYGMVLRAARGAQLPLAHAQDLAAACRWLGGDLSQIVEALETAQDPNGVALSVPGIIDIALANPGRPQTLGNPSPKALIAALCKEAACRHQCQIELTVSQDTATVCASDGPTPNGPKSARASIDAAIWDKLGAWAARTYVPESEASRLSGAGAGLHDND